MDAERRRQITNIFEAGLERDAATRASYIKRACANDDELQREVEALLASHNEASRFIEEPIAEYEKLRSVQGDLGPEAGIGGRGGPDARIARAYALSGNTKETQKILERLKQMAKQNYVPPYNFALIYDVLGEQDEAIGWLQKQNREASGLTGLACGPIRRGTSSVRTQSSSSYCCPSDNLIAI